MAATGVSGETSTTTVLRTFTPMYAGMVSQLTQVCVNNEDEFSS